jgi:hypothetical protein
VGWLKDLMDQAPTEVRSFDELAKICLKADGWPESARMQHRSLGAILGRLDRGEATDWLANRGDVQQTLASVLSVPRGTLVVASTPRRNARPDRWITWQAMPYARGLDLTEEELFPGIPEVIFHPARWDRLVWVAPNGAGRSLAGQWLAARGLAAAETQATLGARQMPGVRPLFVELGSAHELDGNNLGAGLCVAVPEPWEPRAGFDDCAVVRSPPIRALVEPIVEWACARLADRSEVDPRQLVEGVIAFVEQGFVESAGDVLGLVGIADADGMAVFDDGSLERVARAWLRSHAKERLDPEAPEASFLRKNGFSGLVGLARHVAMDGKAPLFAPRSFEDWTDLVPEDLRHGPDLEWLKTALPRADPNVRTVAIERASEKLPPGAFRIVRGFEHAGVLARDDEGLLALRPHWLARVAMHEALGALVSGPAFDWGEALLSPVMAAPTLERLVARARQRSLPVEELVEPNASSDPSYAAAIEGAVRALGAAELGGVHAGGDTIEPLFDEQLRLAIELPDAPAAPRIEHRPLPGRTGAFWLTRGAWYLALLALGEALEAHQGRHHRLLRPWLGTSPADELGAVLDGIAEALDRADAPLDVIASAVALVTRLGALLGPLAPNRARHRLERAASVADEAAVGVLAWSSVAALEGDRLALLGLLRIVDDRRLEPATFATQVWQAFEQAGMPEGEIGVLLEPGLARLILPHAPPGALRALVRRVAALDVPPPLTASQWATLLVDAAEAPLALFRRVPEDALGSAVDAACRSDRRDALLVLWTRFPAALTRVLRETLADPSASLRRGALLVAAPSHVVPAVLAELADTDELLRGPLGTLEAVRRFLHAQVTARGPAFRAAYARLDEIEAHFEDVAQARAEGTKSREKG